MDTSRHRCERLYHRLLHRLSTPSSGHSRRDRRFRLRCGQSGVLSLLSHLLLSQQCYLRRRDHNGCTHSRENCILPSRMSDPTFCALLVHGQEVESQPLLCSHILYLCNSDIPSIRLPYMWLLLLQPPQMCVYPTSERVLYSPES